MMYDCIIIGGGIAGLQAAIQLGRYQHEVLVIDAGEGRSTLCKMYKNLLGWPEGISGRELRRRGKAHALKYGVCFKEDTVIKIKKNDNFFQIKTKKDEVFSSRTILIATGISDNIPSDLLPKLKPFLGLSIFVCPDCDGYEIMNKRTIVLGSGDVGGNMALTLTYWSDHIVYINHEMKPLSAKVRSSLEQADIKLVEQSIREVLTENGCLKCVLLEDQSMIHAEKAFIAFGGNHVHSELAKLIGVHCEENMHIDVNHRTKETNIENVWAAGDLTVHSEQVSIAMGEGAQSAIWIHKRLMEREE